MMSPNLPAPAPKPAGRHFRLPAAGLLGCIPVLLPVLFGRAGGAWGAATEWRLPILAAIECAGWWAAMAGAGMLFWWMLTRVTGARWSDPLAKVWRQRILPFLAGGCFLVVLAAVFRASGGEGGLRLPGTLPMLSPALPAGVALLALAMRLAQRREKEKCLRFVSATGLILLLPLMAAMAVAADGGWETSMAPLGGIAQAAVAALALTLLSPEMRNDSLRRPALLLTAVALAFSLYFSFSRFLIVSYGQIPSETVFYHVRHLGGWGQVSILLGILSAILPLAAVLPATLYRSRGATQALAWVVLAATIMEACWRVLPAVSPSAPAWAGCGLVALSLAFLIVPAAFPGKTGA